MIFATSRGCAASSNRAAGALAVPAGGRATLLGLEAVNPGAEVAYFQAFDRAAELVVLGETAPVLSYALTPGARRLRLKRPASSRVFSYAVTSTRTGAGMPSQACSLVLTMSGETDEGVGSFADPLSVLDDDFETAGEPTPPVGWEEYQPATIDRSEVGNGYLLLTSTVGGVGGSFIYNENRGSFLFKRVRGDFDYRSRNQVLNAVGDGTPATAAGEWRFAGPGVADPDDSQHNALHIKLGADPTGQNRIEWKTTDGDVSTWDSVAGAAPLYYDLRIVRLRQVFRLYYRVAELHALEDDADWTLLETIDRSSNATPPRVGGAAAVTMPNELLLYLCGGYSNVATLDVQLQCFGAIVRTP